MSHGDDDLHDLIDSSFGDGPVPVAAADRLVPARRALRRRRLVSGGATVGGVAAALTVVALVAGGTGGDGGRAVGPAGPGRAVASPAPDEPTSDCDTAVQHDPTIPPADLGDDCEVGTVVGEETGPVESEPPRGGDGADLVRFADDARETLVAVGDTVIAAQSGDVVLPERFAPPGVRTAVAQVTAGDRRVYVLARELPGTAPEYISHPGRRFPTIAAFLVFAEGKYTPDASGGSEGLR